MARAALADAGWSDKPWAALLAAVKAIGEEVKGELEGQARAELELFPVRERKRIENEWNDRIRRARRRAETGALDRGLQLVSLWYTDLAYRAWGADDLVRNADRLEHLRADSGRTADQLIEAIDLVEETRLRFPLNVSEELACEALAYRLGRLLAK
jgi:DNA polymerase-3 subunit delta'